jgi:microcystin-dependent protein
MAVTTTTRLGITRWSSPSDPFNRTQLDDSHAALEAKAAMFLDGAIADRPAAGSSNAKAFYYASDTQILYFSTGSTWVQIGSFGTPTPLVPGNGNFAGVAVTGARSDHVHGMHPYGTGGQVSQVTTSANAGIIDAFARIDHTHTLADGAVTAGKIAAGGVSASGQVASGIIQSYHIAEGAIGDAAVNPANKVPIGGMMPFGGTAAPTGWLMCDGTSYSTSSYSALFGVIGYRYGGSGANFNVPNFMDKLPRGATVPTDATKLGLSAGADTATLSVANIPEHSHSIAHDHAIFSSSVIGDHQHTIDHTHGTFATSAGTPHTHTYVGGSSGNGTGILLSTSGVPGSTWSLALGTGGGGALGATFFPNLSSEASHYHSVTIGALGAVLSGLAGTHSHTVDVPAYSGTSGLTGSTTGFDIKPKSLTVNFIIKI